MSRIGKKPIEVPDKVEVKLNGLNVSVKGPKGQLEFTFADGVEIKKDGNQIVVAPKDNDAVNYGALWGMTRTLVNNMVIGVTEGFTKKLTFTGVGYKAAVKGDVLTLNLGYSHPIDYKLPQGITAKVDKAEIAINGCDKELVGFVAAKVRSFRPPEPYKGKGVRYIDEYIIRKAGKAGGK